MAEASAAVDEIAERLVAGTFDLIRAEGSSALGVRRLAQAANRSPMCVYSHFGSRGKLLTEVYSRGAEALLHAVSDGGGESYLEWAAGEPEVYSLLFDQDLSALDVEPALRRDLTQQLVAQLSLETWVRLHGQVTHQRILATHGR